MKLTVTDIQGKDQGELEVGFAIPEAGKGHQAVHDAVTAYRAAQRSGTASTKTMGDVACSGRKPWRQKGTGRARTGTTVATQWRGGGVPMGPKPRDFGKKLSRKTRLLALRKALGERLKDGDVSVIDELTLADHKTRGFVQVCSQLGLQGTLLVVVPEVDKNLNLATRNLEGVQVITAADLHTYAVLRPARLLFTRGALEKVGERLKDLIAP